MAPNRGRNRTSEFDEFIQTGAKDFDPEVDDFQNPASEDNDDQSASDSEHDGREHYAPVAKSKLRKPKAVPLGPQYSGSKIGRDALDDEPEDDPFSRGFDEEDSADDISDAEDDEGESDLEDEDELASDEVEGTSDTDLSDEEDEALDTRQKQKEIDTQAELRQIVSSESRRTIAESLSQANKEDAEKGRAVKRQRTTFDSLLSTRMKLQKTLVATNTLVGASSEDLETQQGESGDAFVAAEQAAFQLWNSLNDLREELVASHLEKKKKRKHSNFSIETSTSDLWAHFEKQEDEARSTRNSVLEKWSKKAQGPSVQPDRGRLNQDRQATIIDVLQEQLSNTDRLIKKTRAPRSCAPLQAAQRVAEDEKIYDDADFYGLMLKELLEQKSNDSVAVSSIDIGFQMRRDNKTKRNVDTKASKGRKIRYTVQEKLQNFMAPEDRSTWGQRQADELFGSLFGQRIGLVEQDDDDEKMEDDVDPMEAGLMMFRN